jgi:hypothetical protein
VTQVRTISINETNQAEINRCIRNLVEVVNVTTSLDPSYSTFIGFLADKNGTNQTGIASATFTKSTATHEVYDDGGYYDAANSRWTPPAGKVHIGFAFHAFPDGGGSIAAGGYMACSIFKNGTSLRQNDQAAPAANVGASMIVIDDVANGTDYYEPWVFITTTSGTAYVSGNPQHTYFYGHVLR